MYLLLTCCRMLRLMRERRCPTCALSYAARVGFRSNDSDPRHAPGESARVRPLLRPAAATEGRVLSSAHCPHCQTRRFFSRGDIDRRTLQRAPPPSATGVREAPPKSADVLVVPPGDWRAQTRGATHSPKEQGGHMRWWFPLQCPSVQPRAGRQPAVGRERVLRPVLWFGS